MQTFLEYLFALHWNYGLICRELTSRSLFINDYALPLFMPSLMYRSESLTYIIFLPSEELFKTFLARMVYWQKISFIFVCVRKLYFSFYFWGIISLRIVAWWFLLTLRIFHFSMNHQAKWIERSTSLVSDLMCMWPEARSCSLLAILVVSEAKIPSRVLVFVSPSFCLGFP